MKQNGPVIFQKKFFSAYKELTDYGACCNIIPHLHFVDPRTKDSENLDFNLRHSIPPGVKHGLENGLKLVLDVESFDYAYDQRRSTGFKAALTNSLDAAVINQEGFYIAPGFLKNIIMN